MRFDDASQPVSDSHEPVARPDLDILPPGSFGPATGNAITGQGTNSGPAGADSVGGAATITQVQGAGGQTVVSNGNFQVPGQYGVLQMDAQGNFNYVRNPNTPDGVKDVFNYTVADAAGNASTTLTIDIAQVAAAAAGQGVVALPAGVELSDIHINGRDLVINMPDGTQMVIPNGAVFVPEITIGDVQVPPTNIAALLIDTEPQPAAGPAPSSGGDWNDPVPPLAPGVPLGDLIPPTELSYTPPTFVEAGGAAHQPPTVVIETPDNPAPGVVDAHEEVFEKGLPARDGGKPAGSGEIADGNPSNNSDPSETNTGTIVFTADAGVKSVTVDGVAITQVGQTIQGQYGTMTITGIDLAHGTITYSYTLADNTSGDNTADHFAIVVTDSVNQTAAATLTVNIVDDVPTARNDTDTVDANNTATGNVITGADTTSGAAGADTVGADNASLTSVSSNSTGQSDATFDASGNLVVHGEFGTLTIKADGSYVYTLDANTHGGANDVFTYTITDGDGDTSTATLTITVPAENVPPVASDSAVIVSEEALASGNHDAGGSDNDSANDVTSASGTINPSDANGDSLTITLGIPAGSYTSGGQAVHWSVSADGHTLTGYTGSDPTQNHVVVVTIGNNGQYNVQLFAQFDDPSGNGENSINFIVPATVDDGHGGSTVADITVTVEDDTPIARNDTDSLDPNLTATGNVITGAGTTSGSAGADSFGADGPGAGGGLIGISSNFSHQSDTSFDQNGNLVVHGEFGTLTIKADGSYVYSLDANSHGGGNDVFTYTITDGDGDQTTATLTINVPAQNQPPVASNSSVIVSEEALAGGNHDSGGSDSDSSNDVTSASGTISASDPDGDPLTITLGVPSGNYTSHGQTVNWSVSPDGHTLTGYTGNDPTQNHVVVVTIDSSGAYNVQLLAQFDDPNGNGENSINFSVPVTVSDNHGASTHVTIGVTVEDDTPTISASGDEPSLTVSETALNTPDSASFAGAFTVSFGADGPAASNSLVYTLGISSNGVDSGLVDTATGQHIVLTMNGGVVEGHVGTTGGALAFTVTVDSSGNVSLDQVRAVVQPDGTNPDTGEGVSPIGSTITLTATATDYDGDQASQQINIGDQLTFTDAGPTISATGEAPSLTVDETNLGTDDTKSFAGIFTSSFGPDGPGTIAYALGISSSGADSGLIDTATGNHVFLFMSGNEVVGREGADAGAAAGGPIVFTLSIDTSTGDVTLDQSRAVVQPDGTNPDTSEGVTLSAASLVTITATITDGDGDSSTASANIGQNLNFLDDGPTISASGSEPTITVTETALNTPESSSFAGAFTVAFGADGPAASNSLVYALGISSNGVDSGLIDTATGQHIVLVMNGGVVEGHVGTTGGALAFTVTVDSSGSVTLDQVRAVVQPDGTNPDTGEGVSPIGSTITLTATATDGDGDQASQKINIGDHLVFDDAGPTISATGEAPSLTVDETNLGTDDTKSFASIFTSSYGPDGPGSIVYGLSISSSGADSGLIDTATGNHVFLFMSGNEVVGREGANAGAAAGGPIVFTLSVDTSTGNVTLDQSRAVVQPDPTNPDTSEGVTLASNGLVSVTATITDGDGDSSTASAAIGQSLHFLDDGPTISASGSEPTVTVTEVSLGTPESAGFASAFTVAFGADGPAASNSLAYALGISSNGVDSGLIDTATGQHIVLVMNGGVVEGHVGTTGGALAFTVTVNASTGNVTLDQVRAVVQPDGTNPDTHEGVSPIASTITLTATATDGDGDQASQQINIGDHLVFDDAGPTISATGTPPSLTVDETNLGTDDTKSFASVFTGAYGPDGAGTTTYALGISSSGVDSGLIDTVSGNHVFLFMSGSEVVGREGANSGAAAAGPIVFTLSINTSTGDVTLDQSRAVVQPDGTNPDTSEGVTLSAANLVTITATITDGDGDSAKASANIGQDLHFLDDGPTAQTNGNGVGTVILDESAHGTDTPGGSPPVGTNSATINLAAGFVTGGSINYGADGPAASGAVVYSLHLTGSNVASGLYALDPTNKSDVNEGQGSQIVLNQSGNTITGSVGATVYFTITINPTTGVATFTQVNNIWNPVAGSSAAALDDTATLMTAVASALQVQQTITDGDGDSSTASINIGQGVFEIQDSGPTAITPDSITTTDAIQSTIFAYLDTDHSVTENFGTDGPGDITFTGITNGMDSGFTSGGAHITYWLSADGQTLDARINSTNGTDGTLIFEVHIDQSTSQYDYTQYGLVDNGSGVQFNNLTSTKAGTTVIYGVGADVTGSPDVDAMLSATSGGSNSTINTNVNSIGIGNQMFNVGDSLRIDFVQHMTTDAGNATLGFDYTAHVDTNLYSQNVVAVLGNTNVSFQVWALETSDTQSMYPDSNPSGGFTDSTKETITTVGIQGTTAAQPMVTITLTAADIGIPVTIAYGVTATLQADGSVIFGNVPQGFTYEIGTGANNFNAVDVQDVSGKFKMGVFALGHTNLGNPVDLSYGLQIEDADGDTVALPGAINITLNPSGQQAAVVNNAVTTNSVTTNSTSTSGLIPGNDNGPHDHRVFNVGHNAAVMGALAAAGLEIEHSKFDWHALAQNGSSASSAKVAHYEAVVASAIQGGASVAPTHIIQPASTSHDASSVHHLGHHSSEAIGHGHAGHSNGGLQPLVNELLHGSAHGVHGPVATAGPIIAPSVAMPSAQQLVAALGGHPQTSSVTVGGAVHNQVVSQVLADALHGGESHGPSIDALVNSHGGHVTHDVIEALASHAGSAVPFSNNGLAAAFHGSHNMFSMAMAHHDATPHHG